MSFPEFMQWAFLGMLSAGVLGVWKLYQSVQSLNVNVAVMLERMSYHERDIKDHTQRIVKLEQEKT